MKLFNDKNEALKYVKEQWGEFLNGLDHSTQIKLLSIQSHGRRCEVDDDIAIINTYSEVIKSIPPVKEDIVVYRGGYKRDFYSDRPFLATSLLKSTAQSFADNPRAHLYKIIIKKGARVVPGCGLNVPGAAEEEEVVIDTKRLHKRFFGKTFYYY